MDLETDPPTLNVSDAEKLCLTASLGVDVVEVFAFDEEISEEVAETALTCLENESLLRLFLTPYLMLTGPLSAGSSDCIRAGFGETDYAALLQTAAGGGAGQPADEAAMMAGMTTFIVTLSCLNDDEFAKVAPFLELDPAQREGFACVLEHLGGPQEMAALMAPDAGPPIKLFEAAMVCQVPMVGN